MNIKDVKQYLSSLVVVLHGMNDPTGMQAKTCECITAILDHCEALEVHIEANKPGFVKLMESMEEKKKQ